MIDKITHRKRGRTFPLHVGAAYRCYRRGLRRIGVPAALFGPQIPERQFGLVLDAGDEPGTKCQTRSYRSVPPTEWRGDRIPGFQIQHLVVPLRLDKQSSGTIRGESRYARVFDWQRPPIPERRVRNHRRAIADRYVEKDGALGDPGSKF